MKTTPIETVLPEKNDEFLQTILDKFSDCIREGVNFGTHILLWDVETKRDGKDNNIPSAFLRNIIEIGDAISILMKSSSIDPGKILLRTLIENAYCLTYMIEKEERKRVLSYMVWQLKKDINHYKQFLSEHQSSKELKSKLKKGFSNTEYEKHFDKEETKNVLTSKINLLKTEDFKDVHAEYLRTHAKKKNPNWYSLYNGPENFENLSAYLGKTIVYEFAYRKYSENVHSTNVMKGFSYTGNGTAQIIQIRDFEKCKEVFMFTVLTLLETYIDYIRKRIPNKEKESIDWAKNFKKEYDKIVAENIINYQK